jgi:hypothetical protein
VALPVFKTGRSSLSGEAGFDSQALPPSPSPVDPAGRLADVFPNARRPILLGVAISHLVSVVDHRSRHSARNGQSISESVISIVAAVLTAGGLVER